MYLKQGDIVDIVAPGSACSREELLAGANFLKSWGLEPRFPEKIFRSQGYLSHSDEVRFNFFREALLNSSSQAIWCVRGGYGSLRLLPLLQKMKSPKKQKILIGLSDITSLHIFLQQEWGWRTVHGPLLERMGGGNYTPQVERDLKNLLLSSSKNKGQKTLIYKGLKPLNIAAKKERVLHGVVTGGNLVVASSTLGTPWQMETEGKIVFFEEVGERGYRVDRLFQQWLQTGQLQKAKAIILGEFTGGEEVDGQRLWKRAIRELAENFKKPVLSGFPCGHGKVQRPLILGQKSRLHLGGSSFLETPISLLLDQV